MSATIKEQMSISLPSMVETHIEALLHAASLLDVDLIVTIQCYTANPKLVPDAHFVGGSCRSNAYSSPEIFTELGTRSIQILMQTLSDRDTIEAN